MNGFRASLRHFAALVRRAAASPPRHLAQRGAEFARELLDDARAPFRSVAPDPAQWNALRAPDLAGRVPVVMCTWKRPDLLASTLASLSNQRDQRVHLFVWNNNSAIAGSIERAARNAAFPVTAFHSRRNVGGFGRFYWARLLGAQCATVLFIDDDQVYAPDAVATFLEEAAPRTIVSQWAFRFLSTEHYWKRERVEPGEVADYCGTGGMACDASVFAHPEVFQCPRRFWFVEDLWLCFVASQRLGWSLRGSRVRAEMYDDAHQLSHRLTFRKSRFLRHLVHRRGWRLTVSETQRSVPSP